MELIVDFGALYLGLFVGQTVMLASISLLPSLTGVDLAALISGVMFMGASAETNETGGE
jgi:hypothetical protein